MKHLIWIFTVVLVACSGTPKSTETKTVNQEDSITEPKTDTISPKEIEIQSRINNNELEDFLKYYQKFTNAITDLDLDKVNACIHPDGLYFIETNGAMPLIQKVYDVKAYSKKSKPTTFFNLGFNDIENQPIFDTLPKVICAGEVYDKYGCFAETTNPLKNSGIWNYSNLNVKEIQAIEFTSENIDLTVRNTQNFTFYFSKTEQGWKLSFIDIRTPCEA